MKNTLLSVLILTFLLAAPRTNAEEEAVPADTASKPPIQNDLTKADKPEAKSAPKPDAKAEAPAKAAPEAEPPVARPAAKAEPKPEPAKKPVEPAKELNPSAKIFVPLADTYKKAYEDMLMWIRSIDAETAEISTRIARIQEDIQKNEAAITKLKIDSGGESSDEGRALAKDTKQLWADLSAARKERTALSKGFMREANSRAKSYQAEVIEKLEDIKAQPK